MLGANGLYDVWTHWVVGQAYVTCLSVLCRPSVQSSSSWLLFRYEGGGTGCEEIKACLKRGRGITVAPSPRIQCWENNEQSADGINRLLFRLTILQCSLGPNIESGGRGERCKVFFPDRLLFLHHRSETPFANPKIQDQGVSGFT